MQGLSCAPCMGMYGWNQPTGILWYFVAMEESPLKQIKGPDNPTSQLLPIIRNKSCSGTGKERKTKEVVEDREVKKSCMWRVVCDKVVCDVIMCVKDCVQWRTTKRRKCFHPSTGWQMTIGRSAWPRSTHTCIATKIKRCKCFFPRLVKAMRLLQQDRRASYDTSN